MGRATAQHRTGSDDRDVTVPRFLGSGSRRRLHAGCLSPQAIFRSDPLPAAPTVSLPPVLGSSPSQSMQKPPNLVNLSMEDDIRFHLHPSLGLRHT